MKKSEVGPQSYLECFEFFLAPCPVGGTPGARQFNKAPDADDQFPVDLPSRRKVLSPDTLQAGVEAQRAAES